MLAEAAEDPALAVKRDARERIYRLEGAMRQMPQKTIEPEHTFGPGFYARTMRIPAGTVLTGRVHSTEHLFALSQGEMLLATEDGSVHVKAPFQCVARPGTKRVGYAVTDSIVTNFHLTSETDLAKLEAALIVPEALEASFMERLQ
jgi:hypothetical protein